MTTHAPPVPSPPLSARRPHNELLDRRPIPVRRQSHRANKVGIIAFRNGSPAHGVASASPSHRSACFTGRDPQGVAKRMQWGTITIELTRFSYFIVGSYSII